MENESTMHAASAAIRWTDAEWKEILARLLQGRGDASPGMDVLAEIGAKQVFEAQQVLPEPRRRKQVAIAQGFQGIRACLGEILQRQQAAPDADRAHGDLADLAEAARPFIAMVCEELANALVRTSRQAEGEALLPLLASLAAPGMDPAAVHDRDALAAPHGTAGQVGEERNAWLENPEPMSSAPRREAHPGNGKRRGKWPPRVSR